MRNTSMNANWHSATRPRSTPGRGLSPAHRPVTALLALSACSASNWYAGTKASGEAECRKQPPAAYEECMRSYEKTCLEYTRQREQAIQK